MSGNGKRDVVWADVRIHHTSPTLPCPEPNTCSPKLTWPSGSSRCCFRSRRHSTYLSRASATSPLPRHVWKTTSYVLPIALHKMSGHGQSKRCGFCPPLRLRQLTRSDQESSVRQSGRGPVGYCKECLSTDRPFCHTGSAGNDSKLASLSIWRIQCCKGGELELDSWHQPGPQPFFCCGFLWSILQPWQDMAGWGKSIRQDSVDAHIFTEGLNGNIFNFVCYYLCEASMADVHSYRLILFQVETRRW